MNTDHCNGLSDFMRSSPERSDKKMAESQKQVQLVVSKVSGISPLKHLRLKHGLARLGTAWRRSCPSDSVLHSSVKPVVGVDKPLGYRCCRDQGRVDWDELHLCSRVL